MVDRYKSMIGENPPTKFKLSIEMRDHLELDASDFFTPDNTQ